MAFDTLTYAKKLQESGVPSQQAEAHAEALKDLVESNLATKQDIESVRLEIELLRGEFRHDPKETNTGFRRDMKEMGSRLRRDMKEMGSRLRRDMKEMETGLRHDMKEMDTGLRHQIELVRRDILIKLGGIVVAGVTVLAAMIGVVIALVA